MYLPEIHTKMLIYEVQLIVGKASLIILESCTYILWHYLCLLVYCSICVAIYVWHCSVYIMLLTIQLGNAAHSYMLSI